MPELEKIFYVNTGKDGILADTTKSDVEALVAQLKNESKIILHFHGGLVSKARALESAGRLKPHYRETGAHPVFFVWESDLLSTLRHNLDEISKEDIFKNLVTWLVKFTVAKLLDVEGCKATGQLDLPGDIEVAIELKKRETGAEPYSDVAPSSKLEGLNEQERENFEDKLKNDAEFQKATQAIIVTKEDEEQTFNSKGVLSTNRRSAKTLMSPEVLDELKDEASENEGKGILSTLLLVKRAGGLLVRVIRRFLEKRDHGVYCTIVEEILRDLYLANIGAGIWEMMKKETKDTFDRQGHGSETRGGRLFIDKLSELIAGGHKPEVTLIGHSAGAIFLCNLLRYIENKRRASAQAFPNDFKFKNVIFLAPACNFKLFNDIIENHRHLFENFRMFTMDDKRESGKPEVPLLYSRSLLYLISGILEKEHEDLNKSAYDMPIVGMQRYYNDTKTYNMDEVTAVRRFINADPRHAVWSVENQGAGLVSSAEEHGGFAEEKDTLASIKHIIKQGWES